MTELFDAYNRRARLYPGAIVALPVSALVALLFVSKPAWWTAMTSVVLISGLSYMASQIIRHAGRQRELQMWSRWGGAPTTQALRFRGSTNRTLVERRHRLLRRLVPDEPIPDEAAEAVDPRGADQTYETVVSVLRSRTRSGFDLLFHENCTYGFWRNLLACRTTGLVLCAASFATATILFTLHQHHVVDLAASGLLAVAVIDVTLAAVFLWIVNEAHVRAAGERYATQLFEAAEKLDSPTP